MLCNLPETTIITVEKVFTIMSFCLSLWYGEYVSEYLVNFHKYLIVLAKLFQHIIPLILKFVIFIFTSHILAVAILFSCESQLAIFIFLNQTLRSSIAIFYYHFKTHSGYYLIYRLRPNLFPDRKFMHLCNRAFSLMDI